MALTEDQIKSLVPGKSVVYYNYFPISHKGGVYKATGVFSHVEKNPTHGLMIYCFFKQPYKPRRKTLGWMPSESLYLLNTPVEETDLWE